MAARHLKGIAEIKGYEAKQDVGGVWLYSDISIRTHPNLESDAFYKLYKCLHETMYNDLTTNLPKNLMTMKDFPYPADVPQMQTHKQFLKYLKDYCEHFQLYDHFTFNTTVVQVKVETEGPHRYSVTSVPTKMEAGTEETKEYFDYVLVCTGHFSLPKLPEIPGRESFAGTQFHVHDLREFERADFDDKNVLIIGMWASGFDVLSHIFTCESTR
jgi:cation diffusion facilitator CzcD-associated flavoprotein CzcO